MIYDQQNKKVIRIRICPLVFVMMLILYLLNVPIEISIVIVVFSYILYRIFIVYYIKRLSREVEDPKLIDIRNNPRKNYMEWRRTL